MRVFQWSPFRRRNETKYESLLWGGTESYTKPRSRSSDTGAVPLVHSSRCWNPVSLIVAGLCGTLLVFGLLVASDRKSHHWPSTSHTSHQPNYVRLIYPTRTASEAFCKSLYSSQALGYPTPQIVGWSFDNDGHSEEASSLLSTAHLPAIISYLDAADPTSPDEIAIIANPAVTWFQLRPSVLIERYHNINIQANKNIYQQLGKAMAMRGIVQTILFSSHRSCEHDTSEAVDAHCNGAESFVSLGESPLNADLIIGPVARLRTVFHAASDKLSSMNDNDRPLEQSLSGLFAEMLHDQEGQREVLQRYHSTWAGTVKDMTGSFVLEVVDYGIGVDTDGELLASHTETDPQAEDIPHDILRSTPPYWTEAQAHPLSLPSPLKLGNHSLPPLSTRWSDIRLLKGSNASTKVPVALRAESPSEAWSQIWFSSTMRALLEANVMAPVRPIAQLRLPQSAFSLPSAFPLTPRSSSAQSPSMSPLLGSGADNSSATYDFYPYGRAPKGSVEVFDGDWTPWEDLCGEWDKAIFADGEGEWRSPVRWPWRDEDVVAGREGDGRYGD